eukprot:m.120621 g.120621  ORF g.120621 m.120621 type:complete len:282 (-) comp52087_c0_seq1:96-941(-)
MNTALHGASKRNLVQALNALVDLGADLEAANMYQATPLHLAACNNQADASAHLLKRGAKVEARNQHGASPLHLAAEANAVECLRVLLKYKADIESSNKYGCPPIFSAVEKNAHPALELLLSSGANPNSVAQNGNTVLHFAVLKGHVECVVALVKHGASLVSKNKTNQTPIDVVKKGTPVHAALSMALALVEGKLQKIPAQSIPCPLAPPATWHEPQVTQWLEHLNLAAYVGKFKEFCIDGLCLKEGLDAETLDVLEVKLPVHRKKLVAACEALFASEPSSA